MDLTGSVTCQVCLLIPDGPEISWGSFPASNGCQEKTPTRGATNSAASKSEECGIVSQQTEFSVK